MNDTNWEKVGGGAQAEAWDFQNGIKTVTGVYVEKRTGLGQKNSSMYILEQPDGETIGVWETAALKTKFENVSIGDEVKIDYLGKVKSKSGNSYHNFDLFRRPGNATAADSTKDDTEDIFNDLP